MTRLRRNRNRIPSQLEKMSSLSVSLFKDRFCAAWTAQEPTALGFTTESEAFTFQNTQYCLQLVSGREGRLRLVLKPVEDLASGDPFIVTVVLVEKPDSTETTCQILASEKVSELPWECAFDGNFLLSRVSSFGNAPPVGNAQHFGLFGTASSSSSSRLRFVIFFEEDPTEVRKDNIERPVQTECAQGTTKGSGFPPNFENLSQDFANLLKNEILPDVKLKCEGRDHAIPAHRAVLAARSEVFAAMFRSEMAESRSGEVDVPDVEDDVIDPFLQYVYSGQIPSGVSDEVVPVLYAAADKYAVHALRETCRDRMVRGLTEENCVHFLTTADAHSDVDFKKSVIDFICRHKAVFKGDAWREFAKKPSLLAMEVYQSKVERET